MRPVSAGYAGEATGRWVVVEQDAPAAIDLHVDEARSQNAALEVADRHSRLGLPRLYGNDPAGLDDEMVTVPKRSAVEKARAADRQPAHHIVSVTFLRLAGRSGSSPLRCAASSTARYHARTATSPSVQARPVEGMRKPPARSSVEIGVTLPPRSRSRSMAASVLWREASSETKATTGKPPFTSCSGPCISSATEKASAWTPAVSFVLSAASSAIPKAGPLPWT